jgi:hypothetical protein
MAVYSTLKNILYELQPILSKDLISGFQFLHKNIFQIGDFSKRVKVVLQEEMYANIF